jgi:hypothetical protein
MALAEQRLAATVVLAEVVGILLVLLEAQALLVKETLVLVGLLAVMAGKQGLAVVQGLRVLQDFTEQVGITAFQATEALG